MEGLHAAQEERAEISLLSDGDCSRIRQRRTISRIAQIAMANETAISGTSEAEINAFLDKILGAMRATVKTGLAAPTATLPGPIKLKTKAHDVYTNALQAGGDGPQGDRPGVRLCAGRLGRECARPPGHHGADGRIGRRHAGGRAVARAGRRERCRTTTSARACWSPPRSAISASTTQRSPPPRAGARPKSAWPRRWAPR